MGAAIDGVELTRVTLDDAGNAAVDLPVQATQLFTGIAQFSYVSGDQRGPVTAIALDALGPDREVAP